MQSYEFVSSEFGGRDRELIPGHTAEVVTDPPSGFIEILIGPVRESRAGSLEDTAAFVLVRQIPAAEADLIFVQQIQPLGRGIEVIGTIAGSVAHTEFADEDRKIVLCAGL